ncbi:MAG: nucleotidyltransferase domain-containing protein [Synechococcus sp.]
MAIQLEADLQLVLRDRLHVSQHDIENFCAKWMIVELSLFGSVLRDDFRDDSDVDVLVVFTTEHRWTLFNLIDMQDELEKLFKRPVDLLQKKELLNPYRREAILKTHRVIYAR